MSVVAKRLDGSRRHIVFDGDTAPLPKQRAYGWMGQDATWYTKVGLGPGHIVLDGDPAPPEGGQPPPIFGPCML